MTKHPPGSIEALAEVISKTVKGVRPARSHLRLVEPPAPSRFDSITRESCVKRVRFLRDAYRLHWLVDQATFNLPGIDSLTDDQLAALLTGLERARECIAEGISFDDAGLVQDVTADIPD